MPTQDFADETGCESRRRRDLRRSPDYGSQQEIVPLPTHRLRIVNIGSASGSRIAPQCRLQRQSSRLRSNVTTDLRGDWGDIAATLIDRGTYSDYFELHESSRLMRGASESNGWSFIFKRRAARPRRAFRLDSIWSNVPLLARCDEICAAYWSGRSTINWPCSGSKTYVWPSGSVGN